MSKKLEHVISCSERVKSRCRHVRRGLNLFFLQILLTANLRKERLLCTFSMWRFVISTQSFTIVVRIKNICNTCTYISGGSRIFQMGGRCFVANGGAHILFSGKKCMKLKEIGLKWGGARLLAPCYSKITIFLWIILNSIIKTSYFTYLRIFWDILYKIIF